MDPSFYVTNLTAYIYISEEGCISLGGVNSRTNLAPLNYKYGYPFLRGFIYQFTCVLIGIGNTCFKVLKKLSDVIDLCGLGGLHHAPHLLRGCSSAG